MLTKQTQLLLSASLDGTLAGKDRETVDRLLRTSAEARAFVRALQANLTRLRNLPQHSLGHEFAAQVVSQLPAPLAAPNVVPVGDDLAFPIARPRLRRAMPAWAVGGIAASFVGATVLGGLVWLRGHLDHDRDLLPAGGANVPVVRGKTAPPRSEIVDQLVANVVRGASERYGEARAEAFVAPPAPTPEPVRFAFGDLKNPRSFDHLKWELAQNSDVHLDITVKYNARSLNRIIESFHKQGVQLVVTAPAEASAVRKEPLLVYCENVQADRLASALKELSEVDVQGKTREASTFNAVRVSPGSAKDHERVAQGLGINPRQLKTPPMPVGRVAALGVVLPADSASAAGSDGEISSFLAARGPVQIGSLQVFLHLEPIEK